MNLIKVHLSTHRARDSTDTGSPPNVSGSAGEMNQKAQKAAGRRTQNNADTLDYQTTVNLVASNAAHRVLKIVEMKEEYCREKFITGASSRAALADNQSGPSPTEVDRCELEGHHYILRFTPGHEPRILYIGNHSTNRGRKSVLYRYQCLSFQGRTAAATAAAIQKYASGRLSEHKKTLKKKKLVFDLELDIKINTKIVIPESLEVARVEGETPRQRARYFAWCDPHYVYKTKVYERHDWLFFNWLEDDGSCPTIPGEVLGVLE